VRDVTAPVVPQRHEALLLDFGGVCLLNPVELHTRTETLLGLDLGTLDWMGPVAPDTDPLWQRMVVGDGVTEREYWAQRAIEVGRLAGRAFSVRDYMTLLYDPPFAEMIRPAAVEVAIRARAAGLGVSVLTNDMRAFHGREWEASVGFFDLVDHIVDCSDTGLLKPDPRAYQRALDIIDVEPGRVLFVDDQPANIDGARRFGFDAIWFDIGDADGSWSSVAERLGLDRRAQPV
jgi:putative hydrolase of the HAD superfamily